MLNKIILLIENTFGGAPISFNAMTLTEILSKERLKTAILVR
jgi:hypothetical protein